jgi:hypothetical protein
MKLKLLMFKHKTTQLKKYVYIALTVTPRSDEPFLLHITAAFYSWAVQINISTNI